MLNRDFQFVCNGKNDDWLIIAGRKTYNFRSLELKLGNSLVTKGVKSFMLRLRRTSCFVQCRIPGQVDASERRVRARQRSLQRKLVNWLFGRTSLSTWIACRLAGSLPFGACEYSSASIV
jgi:hypothetical protein